MKQIYIISILIIFLGLLSFRNSNSIADTQVVVRVDGLKDMKLQEYIERELSRLDGVDYCESSLLTRTVILNINDKLVSQKDLKHALNKWGINADEFHYSKLNKIK